MKIPKIRKTYCPFCKKHTEHKTTQQKFKGLNAAHPMSKGSKSRTKKRGSRRGAGNLGRFSRPPIASWKMTGAKSSKKTDFRFECKECKKTHIKGTGTRSKKLEIK
ncbi:50S ribosomal protein L44e [Nanoarchaeota archaeon]